MSTVSPGYVVFRKTFCKGFEKLTFDSIVPFKTDIERCILRSAEVGDQMPYIFNCV